MPPFTKRAIMQSFIKLLNEMPLDKITVKEIVGDCGVNRNTFYYYFKDVYMLLEECFQEKSEKALKEINAGEPWQDCFIRAMSFAFQNKKVTYNVYNSVSRDQFDRYLMSVTNELMYKVVSYKARDLSISKADVEMIGKFFACALSGYTLAWVADGMKEDPQEQLNRAAELFSGCISNVLLACAEQKGKKDGAVNETS